MAMTVLPEKRINPKTMWERMRRDENLTFEVLAKEFDMDTESFKAALNEVVKDGMYSDLCDLDKKHARKLAKRESNKKKKENGKGNTANANSNTADDIKEADEMKARLTNKQVTNSNTPKPEECNPKQEKEVKKVDVKTETRKEKTTMEAEKKMTKSELEDKIKRVHASVQSLNTELESVSSMVRVKEAQLIDLANQLEKLKCEMASKTEELKSLEATEKKLQVELDNLSIFYIVPPGYRGGLKAGRTYISVTGERPDVSIEKIEDYPFEPSLTFIKKSGYKDVEEFDEAFSFVLLILKHEAAGDRCEPVYKPDNKAHEKLKKLYEMTKEMIES